MPTILGVDPGLYGAIAQYDTVRGRLDVFDMPTQRGRHDRDIIDEAELLALMTSARDCGVTVAFIEEVGGIPGQSAPAAFNFGCGYGLLRMAARAAGIALEPVPPRSWKAAMRVPADKRAAVARASELIPTHTALWSGGNKKRNEGRAEAALIVLYGERVLKGEKR
jgi:hypothetical protein